jgi:hypothetical protein
VSRLKEKHEFAVARPALASMGEPHRRIDYRSMPVQPEWKRKADSLYLIQKRGLGKISGPFEATITIDPASRIDLDNGIKLLIDTAR